MGFLASLLWFGVCLGSKYWQGRWEQRLLDFENEHLPGLDFFAAGPDRVKRDAEKGLLGFHELRWDKREVYKLAVRLKPSVSYSMILLSAVFTIGWVIAFGFSFSVPHAIDSWFTGSGMNQKFWWNWWLQLAVALGTIGAVVVALFGKPIRSKLFPPHLQMKLRSEAGEKTPRIIDRLPDGQLRYENARFYHLKVSNSRGDWSPAKDVEVILVGIEDGANRLRWEGEVPMRWRNQEYVPNTRRIGPEGDCDLCFIGNESGFSLLVRFALTSLTTTAESGVNTQDLRGQCMMVVRLQARCSNQVHPVTFRFQLAWNGAWADGDAEMRQNMVIDQLPNM
jgi:hypothetical protein